MIRRLLPDLGIFILLLLLPLLLFAPVALGSRTLLPADILFSFEPYRAAADALGVSHPQNHLLADLILENFAWKRFLADAFNNRQLPLWDPYIFSGHPFLANGQHSALYPLSLVFYVLPLWRAFGVFTWLQLGLAGTFAYLFARVLGIRHLGGLVAGITFQFSGFMVVSVVHPMIIAGASWLPFILAMAELIIRQRPALGGRPARLPWALLGAAGLGCHVLAGHAENTYFTLLVTALYAAWRLGGSIVSERPSHATGEWREAVGQLIRPTSWLILMVLLGLTLGAVQLVPLVEVASASFRGGEEAASLQQVLEWAYPPRRLIAFAIPNFFGSPAHHSYLDVFSWRRVPAPERGDGQYVYWGIKNYVEGGAYLGLLPLLLSAVAVARWLRPHLSRFQHRSSPSAALHADREQVAERGTPFFALLALFSLGCAFGTPAYALVYLLPGMKQSHSPFRWVFPLTLCVAVLAGFGIEALVESRKRLASRGNSRRSERTALLRIRGFFLLGTGPSVASVLAALAFWGGLFTLTGLVASRLLFTEIEPAVEQIFHSLAKAPTAFPDHFALYSYELKWLVIFGLLLTGTGIVVRVSRCPIFIHQRPIWGFLAVGFLVADFLTFGVGFNPAVDPALLAYTPPMVEYLKRDRTAWRYATFTPPGTTKTMNANVGMLYELQYVAGYDSLFSDQYRDYMELIEEQDQAQYNRIASFRSWRSLDSPLTDLLNVKYVITEVEIPNPKYELVYEDKAVRVYRNLGAMPRAFTLPLSATVNADDFASAAQEYDPRHYVILEEGGGEEYGPLPPGSAPVEQPVLTYAVNEVLIEAQTGEPSWLILTDSYFPGWRAFVQPSGAGEGREEEIEIRRVNGNFRGVELARPGAWTVRFKYSPNSIKVGAFVSFIAGMTLLFLAGLYLWRFFYRESEDADTVQRVAKNSLAPIVLNFFNRFIDFAFAALMARILGPGGMGRYFTAANIYLWFDTLANFGLDMYVIREVARDRDRTRRVFVNTTILRLLLFTAVIPVFGGFLAGRQALQKPLTGDTVWAVILLYLALLPGTIANSLTALFRAFEKHEYPAAIQTVTTIIKVTLGTLALVGNLGIVGLAGTSVLTNLATMTILGVLAWRLIWTGLPHWEMRIAWSSLRTMLAASWPLMASLLLQSLFTGANVVLLQYFQGDEVVGWYNAASKWVMNMLNIIPSLFTFAVFPVLSRQAAEDRARLRRSYRLSSKLLTVVALPTAVVVTLMATPMVWVLSGPQYLPHGAVALRLLVWSIIFGWINSLTNYVLIALNRQRYVVLASGVRVAFAVAANLLLVPRYGYVASAWIIIGGELLLNVLFCVDLYRRLGSVAWGEVLGRPALAGLAMGAAAWAVGTYSRPLALLLSSAVYVLASILLRVLTAEESGRLRSLLPAPLRAIVDRAVITSG